MDREQAIETLRANYPDACYEQLREAVDAAIEDGIAKFGGKKPPKGSLKLPLRDGDLEREDEAYKGHASYRGRCKPDFYKRFSWPH